MVDEERGRVLTAGGAPRPFPAIDAEFPRRHTWRAVRHARLTAGGGALRGLRQRAGASVGILLVAVVAAAAATTGPVYDAAARTSMMRDALATPKVLDRAVEATTTGSANGLAETLSIQAGGVLAGRLGGPAQLARLFQPPVWETSVQVLVRWPGHQVRQPVLVTNHSGQCTSLRLTAGTCPVAARQVMVSASFAAQQHLKPGDTITTALAETGAPPTALRQLTVTGVYRPTADALSPARWLTDPCEDFAHEPPCARSPAGAPAVTAAGAAAAGPDALFTPDATFAKLPSSVHGQAEVWWLLRSAGVRASDLGTLESADRGFLTDALLAELSVDTTSTIWDLAARVRAEWSALDVPVFLVAGQVLLLAWLLLFLIATDAAEARAAEVALARLRGYGRLRTIAFGLSEPALLLLIALPAGTLAGWAFTGTLSRILLRAGTPVVLPWLAVAAAAAATLGGFVAVGAASRRALRRPVTEQWKRTARDATRRGWLLDAVLLTGAAVALAEEFTSGYAAGARSGWLGLLVPGLLALAAAVVASRLLPLACRLAFGPTRGGGGTALFLAVRHIARRPGGMRTMIVLATAFSLATFGLASYAVGQRNITRVAIAQTGADGVLTVKAPAGHDLGAIVDAIDPGGTKAVVVDRYAGTSGQSSVLLAVQPARFASVASWLPGLGEQPRALAAALSPRIAPPVRLPATVTRLRVKVSALAGVRPDSFLSFWFIDASTGGQVPVETGALRDGWMTVPVSGCPCELAMVSIDAPPTGLAAAHRAGSMTLSDAQALAGGAWTPIAGALASPVTSWRPRPESPDPSCAAAKGRVTAVTAPGGHQGIHWKFTAVDACGPALQRNDLPLPVPALVATGVSGPATLVPAQGLDGQGLAVRPSRFAVSVPGAPATGIVVDRALALRAANYTTGGFATEQVWTAPGAMAEIRARLAAAKVSVTGIVTTAQTRAALRRQGPPLASVLFLATAGTAAVLAAGAAVLGLYQAGRRRRHEYAALVAGRVTRRSLRVSLLVEQAAVLGYGALTGIAAGIAAAALVLRNVPEFTSPPASPPLQYAPPPGQVTAPLLVIGLVICVAAALAALAVVRSARPELLREGT